MNSLGLTKEFDPLTKEPSNSKRFYLGLPILFYFGLLMPLLLVCPFLPMKTWTNLDPFSRIIGVIVWLLIAPRLLNRDEGFLKGQDWKFERTNVLFGILSGFVLLSIVLGFASFFDMSKLKSSIPNSQACVVLLFLTNSFVTPFCEELMWRGILWNRLSKARSQMGVLIITSVAFGLAHLVIDFSFVRIPTLILFGFGCGLVRMRWGLSASYATHAVANLLAGFWLFFPTVSHKIQMFLGF